MTLPRIDGLDTASGLRFFAGRAPIYLQALATFAALYKAGLPTADRPGGLPGSTDAAGLQQAVHSLAGASLVLGAADLGAQAQALQALLAGVPHDQQAIALQRQALDQALLRLVRQLQQQLPPN